MSRSSSPTGAAQAPAPRVLLVLSGAAGPIGRAATALEFAVMPQLAALGRSGRAGRLRTVAPHLPPDQATVAAAMLGTSPPAELDPGAIAVEARGGVLAADEVCTVVAVLDHRGDPAPALDVQRAVDALRRTLTWHRIVGTHHGHEILVAGPRRPALPQLEGLRLAPAAPGFLPARQLSRSTVAIAADGATLLGVASLLGAATIGVDAVRGVPRDPVPGRLRAAAVAALIGGAETVVVESRAVLDARRGLRDDTARERAACLALERLDRELVGPLRSAAAWVGACLSVAADLPRLVDGTPQRGDVPLVMSGPRTVFIPEPAPLLAPLGTALPPLHCERGVEGRPVVSSPFTLLPGRRLGPRRFTRDPVSRRTVPDGPVAATG